MSDEIVFEVGMKIPYTHGTIRVMAISEGWIMARYPGAMPFCVFHRDLKETVRQLKEKDAAK